MKDQLQFSPKFLSELKKSLSESQQKGASDIDQTRLALIKSLRDKLASKLNKPSIKIPWSQMEAGDIINWPPTVDLTKPIKLNKNELKTIHELAMKDQLDFSAEFLRRIQRTRSIANLKKLQHIVGHSLKDKLAIHLTDPSIREVPWSQMKAGNIINWPADVKLMSVWQMNAEEVKRVHQLLIQDQLHFSSEFLNKYKMIRKS
jgi:hypothetical protein